MERNRGRGWRRNRDMDGGKTGTGGGGKIGAEGVSLIKQGVY